ncbi:hypothetical protein H0X10_02390 [Candidatus Saccharibacteria bacterium]|nr:hypothetical protein [Candidatus Saccharibacteria bacterium]
MSCSAHFQTPCVAESHELSSEKAAARRGIAVAMPMSDEVFAAGKTVLASNKDVWI